MALLGVSSGRALARLAVADDDRVLSTDRAAKSVSVEDTYERDVTDPVVLASRLEELATRLCGRMREAGLSGRTVTIKVRLYDFTTLSRSSTLADPTDDVRVFVPAVRRLLAEVDTSAGVRLLGVGVSGLADWVQDDLFVESEQRIPTAVLPTASMIWGRRGRRRACRRSERTSRSPDRPIGRSRIGSRAAGTPAGSPARTSGTPTGALGGCGGRVSVA